MTFARIIKINQSSGGGGGFLPSNWNPFSSVRKNPDWWPTIQRDAAYSPGKAPKMQKNCK